MLSQRNNSKGKFTMRPIGIAVIIGMVALPAHAMHESAGPKQIIIGKAAQYVGCEEKGNYVRLDIGYVEQGYPAMLQAAKTLPGCQILPAGKKVWIMISDHTRSQICIAPSTKEPCLWTQDGLN